VQPHHLGYVFNVTGRGPPGQVCNVVDATFEINNATTSWGQNVYVVGSIPGLGSWSPKKAVKMNAGRYLKWNVDITLPKNKSFEFKFIKIDSQNASGTSEEGELRSLVAERVDGVQPRGALRRVEAGADAHHD
jgi:hypothetical protein